TISRPAFDAIEHFTSAFYERHPGLFASRLRDRRILDCHGDLHLEHIHLAPRAINIYDCIEFNDRFRYIDVANDVAFLAMDLDFNGRPDLSRYLVMRMADELGDGRMAGLMDFYKCYRAYVRGKVESFHSVAHAAPEDEKKESADCARRYFQLALRYAVAGSGPVVIALMGRIASGKSVQAAALAEELGWGAVSSDRVRKELAGVPLHRRGTPAEREKLYSAAMTERTYAHLAEAAEGCGVTGGGVILDATFGRQEQREALQSRLGRRGLRVQFVELRVSDEVIKDRLGKRDTSPTEVSDARLEDFEMLTESYQSPVELRPEAVIAVNADGERDHTLAAILRRLATSRATAPEQGGR
ncbi:MAG: AAA family ATPase, partial [Akkermansiaceae bacterium]|nr:AAA family ATPase [Akkermansiaceae bacterium]